MINTHTTSSTMKRKRGDNAIKEYAKKLRLTGVNKKPGTVFKLTGDLRRNPEMHLMRSEQLHVGRVFKEMMRLLWNKGHYRLIAEVVGVQQLVSDWVDHMTQGTFIRKDNGVVLPIGKSFLDKAPQFANDACLDVENDWLRKARAKLFVHFTFNIASTFHIPLQLNQFGSCSSHDVETSTNGDYIDRSLNAVFHLSTIDPGNITNRRTVWYEYLFQTAICDRVPRVIAQYIWSFVSVHRLH